MACKSASAVGSSRSDNACVCKWGYGLSLLVAIGALLRPPELLRPVLDRHLGRCVEPLVDRRGCPCPVTGSGRQDPQLSRRLAHSGPVARAVVRS